MPDELEAVRADQRHLMTGSRKNQRPRQQGRSQKGINHVQAASSSALFSLLLKESESLNCNSRNNQHSLRRALTATCRLQSPP